MNRAFLCGCCLVLVPGVSNAQGGQRQTPPSATAGRHVVIEGVVPDAATKAQLLGRLAAVHGDRRIVDRVQVEAVASPPNWGQYAAAMITPSLASVASGLLEINGQAVRLAGEVGSQSLRQELISGLNQASNGSYTVTDALRVSGAQAMLDAVLANRIIEFQSNSALLTDAAKRILDDMAVPLAQTHGERLLLVGHTDEVGTHAANMALSQVRAAAVKQYLIGKGIDGGRMDTIGRGPDEPVADNATVEGRSRNRRIQFRVL